MNQHKIYRCLCLIVLLSDNSLTIPILSKKLNISQRSVYRYIDLLETIGFEVVKEHQKYSIKPGIVPQTINKLLTNGVELQN